MQEEQRKLQREAKSLAQRLEAVLQDRFTPRSGFDADTPIDKTLQFLQEVIAVCLSAHAKQQTCYKGCTFSVLPHIRTEYFLKHSRCVM